MKSGFHTLHPAVFVTAGFFLIVHTQLSGPLALCVESLLLFAVALGLARGRFLRSLKRLRYVFLALALLFAWQTPGRLVWPLLGAFSPSVEGVFEAAEQALRVACVLAIVNALLARLGPDEWLESCHALGAPLQRLGLPVERFALRLRLVLDYVGDRALDWRSLLDSAQSEPELPDVAHWRAPRALRGRDRCCLLVLWLVMAGYVAW